MEHKKGFYEKYIKRPQDFLCALLACIVLSPVMLVLAILVKIKIGSPVLFTQVRPGLHGEIFKLYKFRTMTNERDEDGELLPDDCLLYTSYNSPPGNPGGRKTPGRPESVRRKLRRPQAEHCNENNI